MNYYPAFLNLTGRKAVVVGGGKVAERKVRALISSGADITLISPSLTKGLRKSLTAGIIRHIPRQYRRGDLKGAFLVIAATDSAETNRKVSKEAPALVNVVDVPEECNFIAPSVVKRGHLVIAISTGGASPAFSRAIRQELQLLYGSEFSGYLKFIKEIRRKAMTVITEKDRRELFLKGLASEEVLAMLRNKGAEAVKKVVMRRLKKVMH